MDYRQYNAQLKAVALLRGKLALDLKASGKTWAEVGSALGVSRQRAQKLAKNAEDAAGIQSLDGGSPA